MNPDAATFERLQDCPHGFDPEDCRLCSDPDREPGHPFGCICWDCSGVELTARND